MTDNQKMPCWVCKEPTTIVRVPKRQFDGRIRCAVHRREHRDRIKASWIAAATRYDPTQNRGGVSLVEPEAA